MTVFYFSGCLKAKERLARVVRGNVEEERLRAISATVFNVEAYGRNAESYLRGPGFLDGPKRWLPHGRPMELYWEYIAFAKARSAETASWSTFYRVYSKIWGVKLSFRTKTQHATCDICIGLKRDIKEAKSLNARRLPLERYIDHIFRQWTDRVVYWALCELSVSWARHQMQTGYKMSWLSVATSVVVIIVDGLDQAKFRLPRLDTQGRIPKAMEELHRPALHVAAAWALGCTIQFFVGDEDLPKNSETQCEMLALLMQSSMLHKLFKCSARGGVSRAVVIWAELDIWLSRVGGWAVEGAGVGREESTEGSRLKRQRGYYTIPLRFKNGASPENRRSLVGARA